MSGNQHFHGSELDGAEDGVPNYANRPLTKAQLEAHPIWQFLLKRFEAHQITANGPSLQKIEMSLGLAPIEYANWVKFNSKGNRIAWSQAVKRPKGEGWQPYTKPKRHPVSDTTARTENSSTNETDPMEPERLITVKQHPDYTGFPTEVYDLSAIAFDVLLSGNADEKTRLRAQPLIGTDGGGFSSDKRTFYDAMVKYCEKNYPNGWHPEPVEFVLTGLQFYPTKASGGLAGPPRNAKCHIPIVGKNGDAFVDLTAETDELPLCHFWIEGYWLFRCSDGKQQSELIGIPTEGKVHTWVHSPYNKAFGEAVKSATEAALAKQKAGEISSFDVGRPADRLGADYLRDSLKQFYDATKPPSKSLKFDPKFDTGKIKIVKLTDIYSGFEYPK